MTMDTSKDTCSQCGRSFSETACGPTHAYMAVERAEVLALRSDRDRIKAQRDRAIAEIRNLITEHDLSCGCPNGSCTICTISSLIAEIEANP